MEYRFTECINFLHRNREIYDFQITKIFLEKRWKTIPIEWLEFLFNLSFEDLNEVPFTEDMEMWPDSLKTFVLEARQFSLDRSIGCHDTGVPISEKGDLFSVRDKCGMNPKKCHEVERLTAVVDYYCQTNGCRQIVDVGSGLGYLGQILGSKYGYDVCGLESEACRTHGAQTLTGKKATSDEAKMDSVTFCMKDKEESYREFDNLVGNLLSKRKCAVSESKCEQNVLSSEQNPLAPEISNPCGYSHCTGNSENTGRINDSSLEENVKCFSPQSDIKLSEERDTSYFDFKRNNPHFRASSVTEGLQYSEKVTEPVLKGDTGPSTAPGTGRVGTTGVDDSDSAEDQHCTQKANTGCHDDDSGCHGMCHGDGCHGDAGVCMTGLHCCGDLTPTAMKFFLRCEEVKCLVCLGCCYHNMSNKADCAGYNMFPLSDQLKEVLCENDEFVINKFALRLAAQETRSRWRNQRREDHEFHVKNVAYRGLLEVFCVRENIEVKKEKRKVARKKDYEGLDSYVNAVVKRTDLGKPVEYVRRKMHDLYVEFQEEIKFIEAITCLQVVLQPVIESLIIQDRVSYLRQHSTIKSQVKAVFDENISPRNLAVIAWKT